MSRVKCDEAAAWRDLLCLPAEAPSLEVCARFEKIAAVLAPAELATLPFYAMPTSALPPEFDTASKNILGWYDDSAYLWLQPHLPEDRGPGPACVLVDVATAEHRRDIAAAAQLVYAAAGEAVPIEELIEFAPATIPLESVLGTATHELAHAIESVASGQFAENHDLFEGAPAVTMLKKLVAAKEAETQPPAPQLDSHGLRFLRVVCHLDHRLRRWAGVCSTHLAAAGPRFNQAPYEQCFAALGDELARCSGKRFHSFAEILAAPMPAEFAACALSASEVSP